MDEKIFGKLRTMGRTNKGRPYVSFHRNCALGGGVHECSTEHSEFALDGERL